MSRSRYHNNLKLANFFVRALEGSDIGGGLRIVNERFRQTRRSRTRKNRSQHREWITIVLLHTDRGPLNIKTRYLHSIFVDQTLLRIELHRRNVGPLDRLTPRNVTKILCNPGFGLRGIKITNHRDSGIIRRVVEPEKVFHVGFGGGSQIVHRSNDRPGVPMTFRIYRRRQDFGNAAVRLIIIALASLVLDDVALSVDGLGRHGIE